MAMPTFKELEELLKEHNGEFLVFEDNQPKLVILDPSKYPNFGFAPSNGSKILVTGGAGYIGSHAVRELQKAGYDVLVLDNLSTGKASTVNGQLIVGDLSDVSLLDKIFSEHQISAVAHFANHIIVEESVLYPEKYFQNNVANGLNLLNAMVKHGVKKLIFSSSAAIYGEPKYVPIDENHPRQPVNPYGECKLIFERILEWYYQSHGLSSVSLRYFNAAGASIDGNLGEEHPVETHLIPKVLDVAAQRAEVLKIYGNDYQTPDGTAVRDYVHVIDLVLAHIEALKKLDTESGSFAYNVGTGQGHSVKEIIDAVMEVTGKMVMIENSPRRPGDPGVLVADVKKIKQELGFVPQYSDINTIISTAWAWHKKTHNLETKSTIAQSVV